MSIKIPCRHRGDTSSRSPNAAVSAKGHPRVPVRAALALPPGGALARLRRGSAGFTLIEVTVALIILTSLIALSAQYMSKRADEEANSIMAGQMQRLGDVVTAYVEANYNELSKQKTATEIPWSELGPYLPPGMDQDLPSPFGQHYRVMSRAVELKNGSKRVDALIYTTGKSQPDVHVHSIKIAQLLGAGGLYIDTATRGKDDGSRAYWSSFSRVSDAQGLDAFFPKKEMPIGRVLYAPFMKDANGWGSLSEELLHRRMTNGHPEWNTMQTDLLMADTNSIKLERGDVDARRGTVVTAALNFLDKNSKANISATPVSDRGEQDLVVRAPTSIRLDSQKVVANMLEFHADPRRPTYEDDSCEEIPQAALTVDRDGRMLICRTTVKGAAGANKTVKVWQRLDAPFSHGTKIKKARGYYAEATQEVTAMRTRAPIYWWIEDNDLESMNRQGVWDTLWTSETDDETTAGSIINNTGHVAYVTAVAPPRDLSNSVAVDYGQVSDHPHAVATIGCYLAIYSDGDWPVAVSSSGEEMAGFKKAKAKPNPRPDKAEKMPFCSTNFVMQPGEKLWYRASQVAPNYVHFFMRY